MRRDDPPKEYSPKINFDDLIDRLNQNINPNEEMNVLMLAIAANLYARNVILKGSTQLENNLLVYQGLWAPWNDLNTGLDDVRVKKSSTSIGNIHSYNAILFFLFEQSLLRLSEKEMFLAMDEYASLAEYEAIIATSSKYNFGNCYELACSALEYILNIESEVRAEVFKIIGGDHVFLVLNRKEGSDPNNPLTWGENAVICDPWDNNVYKASEYQANLKNYFYNRDTGLGSTEPFDPSIHTLSPSHHLNADDLRRIQIDRLRVLRMYLLEIIKPILNTLEKYEKLLIIEATRLAELGNEQKKILILKNKVAELAKYRDKLIEKINDMNADTLKDRKKVLAKIAADAVLVLHFTHQELLDLKSSASFFSQSPSTADNLTNMIGQVNREIDTLWPSLTSRPTERDLTAPINTYKFADMLYNQIPENERLQFTVKHISKVILKDVNDLKFISSFIPDNEKINFIRKVKNKIKDGHIWSRFIQFQLCLAIQRVDTNPELFKALFEAGADANMRFRSGFTPLEVAMETSNQEKINILLEYKASPYAPHHDGQMPLEFAVNHNQVRVVSSLLLYGADPDIYFMSNYSSNILSPLGHAISNRNPKMIDALIFYGAEINFPIAPQGQSASNYLSHEELQKYMLQPYLNRLHIKAKKLQSKIKFLEMVAKKNDAPDELLNVKEQLSLVEKEIQEHTQENETELNSKDFFLDEPDKLVKNNNFKFFDDNVSIDKEISFDGKNKNDIYKNDDSKFNK